MPETLLPEGWWWRVHQAGKHEWFTGHWDAAIYRRGPKWWPFPREVVSGAGWTKTEATNMCIGRLSQEELDLVIEANRKVRDK